MSQLLNKFLWVICLALSTIMLQAQNQKSSVVIQLKDKSYLEVQVCTNEIFRIKHAVSEKIPESLLEKYELIEKDWKTVSFTKSEKGDIQTITTSTCSLTVNTKSRQIRVVNKKNETLIQNINIYASGNSSINSFKESLEKQFGGMKGSGGLIIGDNKIEEPKEFVNTEINTKSSVIEFQIAESDKFYGGGGTSRKSIQHRGEVLRMWAHYQLTEVPVPFLMNTAGWAVFNNNTRKHFFDIGHFKSDKLLIYNNNESSDFYLMVAETMPQMLDLYTTIVGKPYLLPKWAYGFAFGGHTMEDQFDMMDDAVRFRDEKIPVTIMWIEPQWMEQYYDFSVNKSWNFKKFPAEPEWEAKKPNKYENRTLFVHKLHELGYKLALWLCVDHDLTIEEDDYLAAKAGKPVSGKEHWFPHLTKFIDQGVDGFKLDPGRTLDEHPDRTYHNGYTDKEMHNVNQVLLPKQMYRTFRDHTNRRSFHHYCGGYAGTQQWCGTTSGDNGGGKDALSDQLNLGMSGFMNSSADVLEGIDDNIAGLHFGFFLPWVQVNSWYSLHHPWYFKPDVREAFRYYAQLRNDLFPYIYSAAINGSETGMPILRAMPMMYPNDKIIENSMKQYMFGENLLVGIFTDTIYLPEGKWMDYWTGKLFNGKQTIKCNTPATRGGPLFVKGGAIIPMQQTMNYIGEQPIDTLILKVFPYQSSSYTLNEDDGVSFEFEKGARAKTQFQCDESASKVEFSINSTVGKYAGMPANRVYQLEVRMESKPRSVAVNNKPISTWEYSSKGFLLMNVGGTGEIKIVINK